MGQGYNVMYSMPPHGGVQYQFAQVGYMPAPYQQQPWSPQMVAQMQQMQMQQMGYQMMPMTPGEGQYQGDHQQMPYAVQAAHDQVLSHTTPMMSLL